MLGYIPMCFHSLHRAERRFTRCVRRCMDLWLLLGVLFPLAVYTAPVAAQERSVVVERRDGDITIRPNGEVRVVETWQPRFIGGPFRFAYLVIPLNRVEEITDWAVSEGGRDYVESRSEQPGTFAVDDADGTRTITWHFEPTTERSRTFTLAYTLRGALRIYGGGDQFFWKFIGSEWEAPIQAARVAVTLPSDFEPAQLMTQTYRDSAEAGGGRIVNGQTVEFTGGPFAAGDEWEIRVQFPHGAVTAAPPGWQARDDRARELQPVLNFVSLVLALVILLGGLLGVYLLWYTRGRDRAVETAAEFFPEPPEELPPGMAGALLDERADMKDILATLVDLARRGYLRIVERGDDADSFTFVRLRGADDTLRPYERLLFERLFGHRTERDLADLKHKFYKHLGELQATLYAELTRLGYFPRSPQTTRTLYTLAGIGIAVVAGGLGFVGYTLLGTYAPLGILVVIAAVLVGFALAVFGQVMPRKTPKGAAAAATWRAFRRYLQHIDRYTEVTQAQEQFDRYLPYAIAFGVEKDFVRVFAKTNTPAPVWYYPHSYVPYGGHGFGSSGWGAEAHSGGGDRHSSGGSGGPSLDGMAGRALSGLNAMSAGFFSMLNQTAATLRSAPSSSGGTGGFSRRRRWRRRWRLWVGRRTHRGMGKTAGAIMIVAGSAIFVVVALFVGSGYAGDQVGRSGAILVAACLPATSTGARKRSVHRMRHASAAPPARAAVACASWLVRALLSARTAVSSCCPGREPVGCDRISLISFKVHVQGFKICFVTDHPVASH